MTSSGSGTGTPSTSGYHILTNSEAAVALRCEITDTNMLQLLPIVDKYIELATGRDWTLDATIYEEAKGAARMLLVRWHEDPGGMASGDTLGPGIRAALSQLEAKRFLLDASGVPDEGLAVLRTNISGDMAITTNIILIFNHEMAAAATSAVTLEDSAGATVAVANSLDAATKKIMTINPTANLTAAASYTVVVDGAADVYGQTVDKEIGFTTT